MSQTDVLVELIRHATAGNQPAIRQSVERLIADEEQKGHRNLGRALAESPASGAYAVPNFPIAFLRARRRCATASALL